MADATLAQAKEYWSLANVMAGFYFTQAVVYWYQLDKQEFATKIRQRLPFVLLLLWCQALALSALLYGCYHAEKTLLTSVATGRGVEALVSTSFGAVVARIALVIVMTVLSTLITVGPRPAARG